MSSMALEPSQQLFLVWRGECWSRSEVKTDVYWSHRSWSSFLGFFISEESKISALKEVMQIFVVFLKVIVFLGLTGAERLISDTTAKWSQILAAEKKTDLTWSHGDLVMRRLSQWPWTCIEKNTFCFKLKHFKISLKRWVLESDISRYLNVL